MLSAFLGQLLPPSEKLTPPASGGHRGLQQRRPRARRLRALAYQDERYVASDKRRFLLKFVQTCEADLLENAPWPPEVEEAMLLTALRLLPNLPDQFKVKVQCSGTSLADLVYTSLVTGYLCAMVYERLQIQRSRQTLLPLTGLQEAASPTQATTADYVYNLESEVIELRRKLEEKEKEQRTGNALLDSLAHADAELLSGYTNSAGPEVQLAFNSFVLRALGEKKSLSNDLREHVSKDLGNLVYFAQLIGYSLRTLEVQFESERQMLLSYSSIDPMDMPSLKLDDSWVG